MGHGITNSLRAVALICAIACAGRRASATVVYSDGSSQVVNGVTADNVSVGNGTTVLFTNGSAQPGQSSGDLFSIEGTATSILNANNYSVGPNSTAGVARGYQVVDSTLNLTNGSVSSTGYVGAEGISGFGASTIKVATSTVAAQLQPDSSSAYATGSYAYAVSANDSSQVTLNSGSYAVKNNGGDFAITVAAYGSSHVTLRGGTYTASGSASNYALDANGQSVIDVHGGTLSAVNDTEIVAFDTSVINIYGSNFSVDGVPVALGALSATSGLLTGRLENGDVLGGDNFYRDGTATINLVAAVTAVPEPTGAFVLVMGWGLMASRRVRSADRY